MLSDLVIKIWCFFLLLLVAWLPVDIQAAEIKGELSIGEGWRPVMYLSAVNSFKDLNTASYDFLIAAAEIDSTGHFYFDLDALPTEDRLYRLHISKKGDPISTIIIGSKEQNYLHFVMNNQSIIEFKARENQNFPNMSVLGHPANQELEKLIQNRKSLHIPLDIPTEENRKLLRNSVYQKYQSIGEQSQSSLISLLAIHFMEEIRPSTEVLSEYADLGKILAENGDSSPYAQAFIDKLGFIEYQNSDSPPTGYWWLLIPFLLLVGILTYRKMGKSEPAANISPEASKSNGESLSVRERKVLELLRDGKTNKEISSDLHIEVSTVKSHVHSIYNKLGIRSRKDLVR